MVVDAFQGVDNTVRLAVDDKQSAVIHLHPHILSLIYYKVQHTVVQTLDAAGVTRLVVVEVKAIKT